MFFGRANHSLHVHRSAWTKRYTTVHAITHSLIGQINIQKKVLPNKNSLLHGTFVSVFLASEWNSAWFNYMPSKTSEICKIPILLLCVWTKSAFKLLVRKGKMRTACFSSCQPRSIMIIANEAYKVVKGHILLTPIFQSLKALLKTILILFP